MKTKTANPTVIITLFIMILLLTIPVDAKNVSIAINFDENKFDMILDNEGLLHIISKDNDNQCWFSEKNAPALPFLSYNYGINTSCTYNLINIKKEKHLIDSCVLIATNPIPIPTNATIENILNIDIPNYESKIYPDDNIKISGSSNWSDFTIIHMTVCPFEYDARTGELFFIDQISVNLDINNNSSTHLLSPRCPAPIKAITPYIDKDYHYESPKYDNSEIKTNLDYLIITNKQLKASFEPLLNWKKTKGLQSQIITIEEISDKYPCLSSTPMQIKSYLYDKYINEGLKYVLLGGDDKIVPTLKCYCNANGFKYDTMPVDLFYSCFDGSFDWDGNNNGIFGEKDDNINLTSSIYVSRIPTRDNKSTSQYITKLLEYEKNPRWNNNILMAGEKLYNENNHSDAEKQAEQLYDYIKTMWNGTRFRLFDCCSDFESNMSNECLIQQLSKGYSFIDMITHGTQTTWSFNQFTYDTNKADKQENIGHSIILTSACNTNAFDSPYDAPHTAFCNDPCLSESFLRSYKSGIIAYWGSSRENWTYGDVNGKLDPSIVFEKPFYNFLFGDQIKDKNFAKLITLAKMASIQLAEENPTYRWLQYSMNPMGDPEMSLYTTIPKQLPEISIIHNDNSVLIDTGTENCKICIMGQNDSGNSYYKVFNNSSSVELFDIPDIVSVCITKQNYIPKHFTLTLIQDLTINENINISSNIVRIGSNVNPTKSTGNVNIINGNVVIEADTIEIENGFEVSKGASVQLLTK